MSDDISHIWEQFTPDSLPCCVEYKRPSYYTEWDVMCCAQHQDIKKVANKLYRRWENASEKLGEYALGKEPWDDRKFNGLSTKIDKLWAEFLNTERGIDRCCGYKFREHEQKRTQSEDGGKETNPSQK